jgi:hypothetical protein
MPAGPALAQQGANEPPMMLQDQIPIFCYPRAPLALYLHEMYQEQAVSRGLVNGGYIMEVWATADGSTWTMVVTAPGGPACIVATGVGLENLPREPLKPMDGSPA